jgi:hypothetical protein
MYQYGHVILLTTQDQIAVIATRNSRLLWYKRPGACSQCGARRTRAA